MSSNLTNYVSEVKIKLLTIKVSTQPLKVGSYLNKDTFVAIFYQNTFVKLMIFIDILAFLHLII